MMNGRTSSSSSEDESSPVMAAASILASAANTNTVKHEDDNSDSHSILKPTPNTGTIPIGPPCGPLSETVTHERRWETMFERLVVFKNKYGNCLVPNRYSLDSQLGSWVSAQRRQYKIVTSGGNESAAMTPERAKKLRDIGFEWTTTNPRNVPWEQRYSELRAFVANYGHAEVPMRWEENPQLSNWVSKQRHQYKLMQSNRPSRLNAERVQLLNDIGFVWEASRRRLLDGSLVGSDDEEMSEEAAAKAASLSRKKPRLPVKVAVRKKKLDALPTFAEGKPGRFGMDPPAPMGAAPVAMPLPGTMEFAQAQAQAMAAAGQGGVPLANFGLWAAMAAGQGFMPPPAMAAAAAAGGAMNPQLLMQMGGMVPFAGAMPGMPFNPGQFAASMMPPGTANPDGVQQPQHAQSTQDPPSCDDREEGEEQEASEHGGESLENGETEHHEIGETEHPYGDSG